MRTCSPGLVSLGLALLTLCATFGDSLGQDRVVGLYATGSERTRWYVLFSSGDLFRAEGVCSGCPPADTTWAYFLNVFDAVGAPRSTMVGVDSRDHAVMTAEGDRFYSPWATQEYWEHLGNLFDRMGRPRQPVVAYGPDGFAITASGDVFQMSCSTGGPCYLGNLSLPTVTTEQSWGGLKARYRGAQELPSTH